MICPTCNDAKENLCCGCGNIISTQKQELSPNAYAREIYGDESLHLECEDCIEQSAQEI